MKPSVPSGALPADPSQVRSAELLTLRTLAASTQAEYQRYVRKLAANLRKRLREHQLGLAAATASRGPVALIYYEAYPARRSRNQRPDQGIFDRR